MLEIFAADDHQLVLLEPVQTELRRVLSAKLHLAPGRINELTSLLEEVATDVAACPRDVKATSGDVDDDRILTTALAAGVEVLVSGDTRHLLPLGAVEQMRIVPPAKFLAELTA